MLLLTLLTFSFFVKTPYSFEVSVPVWWLTIGVYLITYENKQFFFRNSSLRLLWSCFFFNNTHSFTYTLTKLEGDHRNRSFNPSILPSIDRQHFISYTLLVNVWVMSGIVFELCEFKGNFIRWPSTLTIHPALIDAGWL